jgi:CHAD domain-containing protein
LKSAATTTGFGHWMLRVLHECDRVAAGFSPDPVHDLRVALRRCRSVADGMSAIDPDPQWKAMKKAGKRLFERLGDLRDTQVMMEWIEKLDRSVQPALLSASDQKRGDVDHHSPNLQPLLDAGIDSHSPPDPAARALLAILGHREAEQKREAGAALEDFDRKQWRQWSKTLPARSARLRPGSAVFKHLALERWTTARELHTRALRNRSRIAFHTLRIGIKRFRYIVENFLPEEHAAWSQDLKHMQDLLGEVHDLDVLWATACASHVFPDEVSRRIWHARILEERTQRIDEYCQCMVGPDSRWSLWRSGLPQGKQIQEIATRRMGLWAKALDPDFPHSQRVARLALELYDGLGARGMLQSWRPPPNGDGDADPRSRLYLAALLHDVGKSKGNKGHHKESLELIKKHATPLGWNARDMQLAAIVARFHCGALPSRSHKSLRDLMPAERRTIICLAAILRLANALDSSHNGQIRRLQIENAIPARRRTDGLLPKPAPLGKHEPLIIAAEGYAPGSPTAQTVAAERYLLETVLRRPVVVTAIEGASGKRAAS